MDNKTNEDDNFDIIITPKKSHYFQNKLSSNKIFKNKKFFFNSYGNSSKKTKYKSLLNQNKYFESHITSGIFNYNNELIRKKIILNLENHNKKDRTPLILKKSLKLLEKDIDLYSPKYKRIFSAKISNSKSKNFNQKNETHLFKTNIKKYFFTEKLLEKSSSKEKIKRKKNNLINSSSVNTNNYFNHFFKNNTINSKKYIIKNNSKKRPKSTIILYDIDSNYNNKCNNLNYLYTENREESLNSKNKFRINIVDFAFELNKISNKYEEKLNKSRNKLAERISTINFPIFNNYFTLNKMEKSLAKKRKKNISLNKYRKKNKNNIFVINKYQ